MANKIVGKYYLKNTAAGSYADVTTLFNGVNILSVEGINARGKALNVYVEQWVTGETDFTIASENGVIARANVDISVTFVVSPRYASSAIDPQTVYDSFVNYMTNSDVWIKTMYENKSVHCVAVDKFEPQKVKLQRGNNSYIFGKITLKTLSKPTTNT